MEKHLKQKASKDFVTQIELGTHFALEERLPELLDELNLKTAIITDTNIEKFYLEKIEKLNRQVFSFPPGEVSKSRETKATLEDHLLSHNFGRDSLIVGLGGGVVNDLAGFLASTYCRGVKLIQVPTSLLGMVDAAIGGKTAVNTSYGKNMIGSFYPPDHVLVDSHFLTTLPEKQILNGLAEIIKYALIDSPSLYESMKENPEKWKQMDFEFIEKRILQSIRIKEEVFEKDPFEKKGIRRILNFGHTFGHAIETLENYEVDHGAAISIGMMVSCYLSLKLGYLKEEAFIQINELLKIYKMPMQLPKKHSIDDYMSTLAKDKKAINGIPRLVLLQDIGKVHPFDGEYCTQVDFDLLDDAICWMHDEFAT